MATTLVDTNVLVYAAGGDGDETRQRAAIALLRERRAQGVLAIQVLAEYASVMLRKGRAAGAVRDEVAVLGAAWPVLRPDTKTVVLALAASSAHHLSFSDAMIWAIAKQNGVTAILSEDGPTGATIEGVLFESPWASST